MSKKFAPGLAGNYLIAVMVCIFIVILLPIPVILLDILITINILLSIYLLVSTIIAKKFEYYLLLPTKLLCLILLNTATSFAVTRVILTKGREFDGILIGFIASLISSYELSSVIRSLIFFIVFLVGTTYFTIKGARRVAEVAARFVLDRMVVKLMKIDAEFAENKITQEESNAKKEAVHRESDVYGALDGACKFISGNIKLLIFIFLITIAAGVFIDTKFRHEDLDESFVTYISLAISSGFFTVIPSLLLSLTAGSAIMRSANND